MKDERKQEADLGTRTKSGGRAADPIAGRKGDLETIEEDLKQKEKQERQDRASSGKREE